MITKKDAIAVGTAICKAVLKEQDNVSGNRERVWSARGVGIYALDNLWYDVIPNKVKASFVAGNGAIYSREQFYKDCGWPE